MRSFILFVLLAAFGSKSYAQTFSINHQVANTGDTVLVSILTQNLPDVGAFTLYLGYDDLVLEFDTVVNIHPSANGLLFNYMSAQSQIGLAWSSSSTGIDFSGVHLCDIKLIYLGGETAIEFNSGSEIVDFSASILAVDFISGSVATFFEAEIVDLENDYCIDEDEFEMEGTPSDGQFFIDGVVQFLFDPSSLGAGVFEIAYVYANTFGFSDTAFQLVEIHLLPDFTFDLELISCHNSNDGAITINTLSGTAPFSYEWSNGGTTPVLSNLQAGIYGFTLSDNFCSLNETFELVEPAELLLQFETIHCSSILLSDGSIQSILSGGVPPYQYLWSNGESTANLLEIDEGIYSLTIADNNACTQSDSVYLRALSNQEIHIPSQWSMFSLNIEANPGQLDSIFLPLGTNLDIIKAEQGGVYWPAFMVDQIQLLEIGSAYQIKLSNADTLIIDGFYLHPDDYLLEIPSGWSFLGYLRTTPASIETMLSPVVMNVILVKDSQGSVYWPEYSLNMIGNMKPGEGYQIKMLDAASFSYPDNN